VVVGYRGGDRLRITARAGVQGERAGVCHHVGLLRRRHMPKQRLHYRVVVRRNRAGMHVADRRSSRQLLRRL
jgi:hypothetical protein